MNNNNDSDSSETLMARQSAFLSDVAMVLPGTVKALPFVQLFVLMRAVCILMSMYVHEFQKVGHIDRDFVLIIDGCRIMAGARPLQVETNLKVVTPDVAKWVETRTGI